MKFTIGLIALTSFALTDFEDGKTYSVLENESSQPRLVDQGQVITRQDTVIENIAPQLDRQMQEVPTLPSPAQSKSVVEKPVLSEPQLIDPAFAPQPMIHHEPLIQQPLALGQAVQPCGGCHCVKCCCKKSQFVETTLHLVDGAGCVHVACMKVPVCCLNEAPAVTWKGKLFGRQVATLCWECCDHDVKVVISRRGKVRVRD